MTASPLIIRQRTPSFIAFSVSRALSFHLLRYVAKWTSNTRGSAVSAYMHSFQLTQGTLAPSATIERIIILGMKKPAKIVLKEEGTACSCSRMCEC